LAHRKGRKWWSAKEKLRIVILTLKPGASAARAEDMTVNLVFPWRAYRNTEFEVD
jgi:transposase-like protein